MQEETERLRQEGDAGQGMRTTWAQMGEIACAVVYPQARGDEAEATTSAKNLRGDGLQEAGGIAMALERLCSVPSGRQECSDRTVRGLAQTPWKWSCVAHVRKDVASSVLKVLGAKVAHDRKDDVVKITTMNFKEEKTNGSVQQVAAQGCSGRAAARLKYQSVKRLRYERVCYWRIEELKNERGLRSLEWTTELMEKDARRRSSWKKTRGEGAI